MISLATFLLNKTDIWRDTFEAVIPAFCVWSVDSDNWRRKCLLSTAEYVRLLINKNDCWGSTWDASMNSSVCNKWQCSRLFFWKRWYLRHIWRYHTCGLGVNGRHWQLKSKVLTYDRGLQLIVLSNCLEDGAASRRCFLKIIIFFS